MWFDFLYEWPNWAIAVFFVGIAVAVAVGGRALVLLGFRGQVPPESLDAAKTCMGITGTVFSLILALAAVQVWQQLQDAEKAVAMEANVGSALYRDLLIMDTPESQAAAAAVENYLREVVDAEWPAMARGRDSRSAWKRFDALFAAVGRLDARDPRQHAWLSEIVTQMNRFSEIRRTRIYAAASRLPLLLWIVMLIGTALVVAYAYVLPLSGLNITVLAGLAAALGLVLFLIFALDLPYAGESGVRPTPMVTLIDSLDTIRAQHPPGHGPAGGQGWR